MIWLLMLISSCFASNEFVLPETSSVKQWNYITSDNLYNGVKDTKGYIEIVFYPYYHNGKYRHVLYRIGIEGLEWNNDFNAIHYNGVKCGKKKVFGFKNYCSLKWVKGDGETIFNFGVKL